MSLAATDNIVPFTTRDDAVAIFAQLDAVLERLEGLIAEETDLVRRGAIMKAGDMEADKALLIADYVKVRQIIKANGPAIARHVPELVAESRKRHEAFVGLVRANLAVLATAREVAEDIVRHVSETVGRHTAPKTYGPAALTRSAPQVAARGIAYDRKC